MRLCSYCLFLNLLILRSSVTATSSQKTLETLVAILLELAERQPVLFILEDLHWTNPSTLELLNLVIDQTPTLPYCAAHCRSHFQPAWHHRSYLTEITVNRLSHAQVAQIITA